MSDMTTTRPDPDRPGDLTGSGGEDISGGEGDYALSGFLPYQLSMASNAVSALIAERYRKRFGLKVTEWRVMAVLGDGAGARRGEPLTQRDLTAATLMDKVAVNRACKVLEDRGLVERTQNERDGRSHLLGLTEEGRAIYREVMPLAKATERELFEGFDPDEQASLRAMLERMRARAGMLAEQGG
ncbi:MarR family winged helix-turn-helix transcriptional regulator [Erythrobacter sp.]|jgi:DNA-binding MarR family transcriptional regulator|uniref:MarR family winged helix-turn-helix transcriptional regulator n=1 Tax=Erythrobacter sp. TaxID=1042 RepID=UPI002EB3BD68|nr:MarR family winged helix-turn-helix transcriptional regulator [Erythrobacter sp.]